MLNRMHYRTILQGFLDADFRAAGHSVSHCDRPWEPITDLTDVDTAVEVYTYWLKMPDSTFCNENLNTFTI